MTQRDCHQAARDYAVLVKATNLTLLLPAYPHLVCIFTQTTFLVYYSALQISNTSHNAALTQEEAWIESERTRARNEFKKAH